MNLSNVRVASKLWITILGLLFVMTLSNLWVQHSTMQTMAASRDGVQLIERKIAMAQHMRGNIMRTVEVATAQIATNEDRLQREFTARLQERLQETTSSMQAMRDSLSSDAERQKFEALIQAFEKSKQLRIDTENTMDMDDFHARANFAFGAYTDSIKEYYQAVDGFIEWQRAQLEALLKASDLAQKQSSYLGWGITAVLLLLGIVFARWLVQTVTQPLDKAVEVAQIIGGGDLSVRISSARKDEFGQLFNALDHMATRLRTVLSDVRNGVDAVSSAAGQIASGNLDLSGRTEQSAASLQETAASIEEMTASVNQSADTSRQANQLAATAVQAAERGGDVVQQVIESMEQINASSRKINDIIGVIDGIAFQTNILALNAAVEAARAGEQGRGFAVVAGEVRSLAGRSAEAAKEIKALISASVSTVEAGSVQVAQAGSNMGEIVQSVRRVTDLIGEITASASEQREGFSQVNQAVSNLDQMTQQNAALVEESSAAANAMSEQAHRLLQTVSVFELGHGLSPAASAPKVLAQAGAVPAVAPTAAPKPMPAALPAHAAMGQSATTGVKSAKVAPAVMPTAKASADDDWETF